MNLSPLRSELRSSILWNSVILAFGVVTFISLFYFGLTLEVLITVVLVCMTILYVGGRPAYTVVFVVILISIFLNNANYTFFQHSFEGQRTAMTSESRLLVLLRLPLVLFAVVMVLAKNGGRFIQFLSKNWDVLIFAAVPFFSIPYSPSTLSALQYAIWFSLALLAILGFVYLLGRRVQDELWGEHVAWVFVGGYILISFMVLLSLSSFFGGVLTSAYSHSNFYAFACSFVFVAVLVLDRQRRIAGKRLVNRIPYWLILALGALNLIPVLWSAKRAAVVAAGLAILIYVLANRKSSQGSSSSPFLRTIVVTGVLAAAIWMAIPRMETTILRFERIFDPSIEDASVSVRQDIWKASLRLVAEEYPVFGVGLANGAAATEEYAATEEWAGIGLHSTYVAIFVEMGTVGMLFFMIMCFRSTRFFFRCPRNFRWNLLVLAVPAVLICATEYNLIPGQAAFWPLWIVILLPRVVLSPSGAAEPEPQVRRYVGAASYHDYRH